MLSVSRLSITPVRSFALHHPDSIELGPRGVLDDRRFSLHTDDGRIYDATKNGRLVQHRVELERTNGTERLTMHLATGETISEEVVLGEPTQLDIYDKLFTARPVIGPWADALSAWAGRRLQLFRSERLEHEWDRYAVSIVSEASVQELARQGNDGRPVDSRRFRMLIEIAGAERPHEEDEWLGREVRIGQALVRVTKQDARCVITTLGPDTGVRDFPTLHVIRQYRGVREGRKLDFGVYAEVLEPGRVAVGDPIAPYTRRMAGGFVPDDFEVPRSYDGPGFRLEPLGPQHNERDHEAWMSSIAHIRSTPGFPDDGDDWPQPMSLERNLDDLVRHADDFASRRGFTYTVLDGEAVIGCVYIYPTKLPDHDAEVSSWVTERRADLDRILWATVTEWIRTEWPFARPYYAERPRP